MRRPWSISPELPPSGRQLPSSRDQRHLGALRRAPCRRSSTDRSLRRPSCVRSGSPENPPRPRGLITRQVVARARARIACESDSQAGHSNPDSTVAAGRNTCGAALRFFRGLRGDGLLTQSGASVSALPCLTSAPALPGAPPPATDAETDGRKSCQREQRRIERTARRIHTSATAR